MDGLQDMALNQLRERHMWLMRQALTRSIFEDGALALWPAEKVDDATKATLDRLGLMAVARPEFDPYKRDRGKDWPVAAETMIGPRRLKNLDELLQGAVTLGVPGAYAECGIWRGGTCIYAAEFFKTYGESRRVWGFDSFRGLPEGGHYPEDEGDPHHTQNDVFAVSREEVLANFNRYGIDTANVSLVEGWFRDSLPRWVTNNRGKIAVLRIDGDMYEGTMDPLRNLYPHVSIGGYVIVDDYGDVSACRKAVHDYLDGAGLEPHIHEVDHTCVWWVKR